MALTDEQKSDAASRGTDQAEAEIQAGAIHRIAYPLSGEWAGSTTPALLYILVMNQPMGDDDESIEDATDLANAFEDAYNIAWQSHDDATGVQFTNTLGSTSLPTIPTAPDVPEDLA